MRGVLTMSDKKLQACGCCGCTDIEVAAWIDPNTNEVKDDYPLDDVWCPQCEQHFTFAEIALVDSPLPYDAARAPTWCEEHGLPLVKDGKPVACDGCECGLNCACLCHEAGTICGACHA